MKIFYYGFIFHFLISNFLLSAGFLFYLFSRCSLGVGKIPSLVFVSFSTFFFMLILYILDTNPWSVMHFLNTVCIFLLSMLSVNEREV